MADPVTEALSAAFEIVDSIEETGVLAQIGVSIVLILFALLFTRYFILKLAWSLVKRTEADWDNEMLDPIFLRLYLFILLAGVELTMMDSW